MQTVRWVVLLGLGCAACQGAPETSAELRGTGLALGQVEPKDLIAGHGQGGGVLGRTDLANVGTGGGTSTPPGFENEVAGGMGGGTGIGGKQGNEPMESQIQSGSNTVFAVPGTELRLRDPRGAAVAGDWVLDTVADQNSLHFEPASDLTVAGKYQVTDARGQLRTAIWLDAEELEQVNEEGELSLGNVR